jgi:ribosomal protein L11 methyltransferase
MSYDQWQSQAFTTVSYGKFRIMPPWEASASHPSLCGDEIPILLDPGVVFGTGTHDTTRSCLEALELATAKLPPETVLDLGTGTGLLALAAAKLGCRKICAIDVNMLATLTARNNVCINRLENRVLVAKGKAESFIDCRADLVIANIHYDVMQRLIDSGGFLQKDKFILSGLLRSEAKAITHKLAQLPVKILKTWTQDGIWHTLYGKRNVLLKKVGKPSKIR